MVDLISDADSVGKNGDALAVWTTTRNPLLAMEASTQDQEDGSGRDGFISDNVIKHEVVQHLKRNSSSKDLLFTTKQLAITMQALIKNCNDILLFAKCMDDHRTSPAKLLLVPQLQEALPAKLCPKTVKNKESMADALADV